MFCSKCGAAVPDNAVFCGKCGANIGGNQQFAEAQPQTMQESAVPHQSAVSQQSTTVSGQQMTQQMDRQQTAPKSKAKLVFPGFKIRNGISVASVLIFVLVSGSYYGNFYGLFGSILGLLSYWSLHKANKFFIAGDEENFKKWKNINMVMLVLMWVLPPLAASLLEAAVMQNG